MLSPDICILCLFSFAIISPSGSAIINHKLSFIERVCSDFRNGNFQNEPFYCIPDQILYTSAQKKTTEIDPMVSAKRLCIL